MAILSYTSGTTGNPKAVTHSHGWGMPIYKWHQNIGYVYKRMILYGQLQHQGGKSGCGVHFICIRDGEQQHLSITVVSTLKHISSYFKIIKLMFYVVQQAEYRMMAKLSHLEQYNLEYLHSAVSAGEPLNRELLNNLNVILILLFEMDMDKPKVHC